MYPKPLYQDPKWQIRLPYDLLIISIYSALRLSRQVPLVILGVHDTEEGSDDSCLCPYLGSDSILLMRAKRRQDEVLFIAGFCRNSVHPPPHTHTHSSPVSYFSKENCRFFHENVKSVGVYKWLHISVCCKEACRYSLNVLL